MDYLFFQIHYPIYYAVGRMLGILPFGFLSGNVLRKKMYMTIAFVTLMQVTYIIINYTYSVSISQSTSI